MSARGYTETVTDPRDRWAMAAAPVYTWGATLSSLVWFGFAAAAAAAGHPVLAMLFGVVGVLVVVAGLSLRRRFWRRMRAKYPDG